MVCQKCGSENITAQLVSEAGKAKHGAVWWVCVGWWWWMIKAMGWLLFGLLMLIPKLFSKNKIKTVAKSWAICQGCGYKWRI